MPDFDKMTLEQLVRPEGYDCDCGKHHVSPMEYLKIGRGVIVYVPEMIAAMHRKKAIRRLRQKYLCRRRQARMRNPGRGERTVQPVRHSWRPHCTVRVGMRQRPHAL